MTQISVAAVGECMIELSSDGVDCWKSSYAGDTFNTLWTMRALLPENAKLDYVTAFGNDPFSTKQREFFSSSGIGVALSPTIDGGGPGLYAITLDGFERNFTYWRNDSAARRLADDPEALRRSLADRDLIYFSGITVAILSTKGRKVLVEEIGRARQAGSRVAFDPNYRGRLWRSRQDAQEALAEFLPVIDIALPTFDDEKELYGDKEPLVTVERFRSAGVTEVAVKRGSEPASFCGEGEDGTMAANPVEMPVDTTGAGDAFNGGYLAARISGRSIKYSCEAGHRAAGKAIQHRGALTAHTALATKPSSL